MSKEKLKKAFDAGYDYRSSLLSEVIKEFGENSAPTFEEWYTEQKLLQAEVSASAEGATVASEGLAQNVSGDYEKGYAEGWEDAQRIGVAEARKYQGG